MNQLRATPTPRLKEHAAVWRGHAKFAAGLVRACEAELRRRERSKVK